MKQIIRFIIIGLILSGCSSSYHIKKAKQKCPECFKTDTTINEIVFKLDTIIKIDTNILVFLPTDTARIDTVIKKLKPYSFKPIYVKNGIINVKVSMTRGVLKVSSHIDSAIWYRYRDEILIKDAIIHDLKTVTVKQNITIKEQKSFIQRLKTNAKWFKYIIVGIISLIIIGLGFKFYKWINK